MNIDMSKIKLDVDLAFDWMIVNELILHALKYALSNKKKEEIESVYMKTGKYFSWKSRIMESGIQSDIIPIGDRIWE